MEGEAPVEEEFEFRRPGCTWVYGINDHLDEPEDLGSFVPEGVFRKDFIRFNEVLGAVYHATIGSQRNKKVDASEESTICIRSTLVDHFSIKVIQLLMPTSLHLETLIFSNCRLDVDMLGLLRKGLGAEGCTVHNLQLEWNPLEVPLEMAKESNAATGEDGVGGDAEPPGEGEESPGAEELDLDQLELRRDLKQGRRTLSMIQDFIWQKFGSMDAAWEAIENSEQGAEKFYPGPFAEIADTVLGLHASEAADAFEVLDGIHFGMAEGRVSLNALKSALQDLPEPDGFDADKDPLGDSFAAFVDAGCMLESLSLRSCGISRRELKPITGMLMAESRHITILNLYGNRICDRGVEHLVTALLEYRGLEYLGLGQNRITDAGLACLVKGLGPEAVSADDEAEIRAQVEAKAAEVAAKQVGPPRVDANGRELHERPLLCDELEEKEDSATGQIMLTRKKPSELKTLNVSENPICDAEAIQVMQFQGDGVELVLRQTPAARSMVEMKKRQEKELRRKDSKKLESQSGNSGGWRLIL
eukprot:gnl/MRDRNA2_/MRDRNA2_46585_c0_seq1.p1 gnl/MRDRNA2_/MRDRNA2_46585_c0~~gnl/MRDRNA2_/MRDRNA2_46585_c0_seq1.p1  ORF type:complete len:556 (-),score=126.98 gnl/MRDRNA2_/MRDRNA2_46585_c0_seq1:89-1681(-)